VKTPHLVLALLLWFAAPLAGAEPPPIPDTPAGQQLRWALGVFGGDDPGPMPDRFAPSFLEKVPGPAFAGALIQIRSLGPLRLVEVAPTDEHHLVATVYAETASSYQKISVSVEPDTGLIEGLLIQPAPLYGKPPPASWDEIDAELDALHGHTSLGVYELIDGKPEAIHEHNADTPLAIGSTFKLWVLGALGEYIDSTDASWDDPLAIRKDLKSTPSGTMQNEPPGTEFPISHFADRMISISDNTAADHLLHFVGRERVEAYMARFVRDPDRNRPFLTTREMIGLKTGGNAELLAEFAAADPERRRELLADIPKPSLLIASAWAYPVEVERIEWFATPRELADTFADLHRLEPDNPELAHALRINPGMPFDHDLWPEIAYKGGSEPGVLNMTWLVRRNDDRWFVLALGWVDPDEPVDLNEPILVATRAFQFLADQ